MLDFQNSFDIMSKSNARCLGGEIGRRKGLKIPRINVRAGSTPAQGTILNLKSQSRLAFFMPVK